MDISGLWTCRIFDTMRPLSEAPQKEVELVRAEAAIVFRPRSSTDPLQGAIEWTAGSVTNGLDLSGTVQPDDASFDDLVGTGRTGTGTDGWEYDYQGHLTRNWPDIDPIQTPRPFLVGSVFRAKSHNGDPPRSPAGEVFSFIAASWGNPPFTWEFPGSWYYRSFRNDPTLVYPTPPRAGELILGEAVFKLESPTSTTLKGEIGWLTGESLDLTGSVKPDDASFEIVATGRPGSIAAGKFFEFHYQGHLTRNWPKGVDQRLALVGSTIIRQVGETPPGLPPSPLQERDMALVPHPFIAVKQPG